jgi:hypothetical protein
VKSYLANLIWNYASWAALVLLIAVTFIALIANGFVLPLVLLCLAAGLVVFRYWAVIKTFDFWAVDEWARARMDTIGIRDWYTPYHAAEHFCDPNIVRARNDAAARMNSIMMELIKDSDRHVGIPNGASASHHSVTEGVKPFSGGTGLRQLDYEAAQARRDQNNLMLAHDLLMQLMAGELVAKGLPTKNDTTESERIIATSRWRIMGLDISKAEASGRGLHYIGVVIGKKPANANIAKRKESRPAMKK